MSNLVEVVWRMLLVSLVYHSCCVVLAIPFVDFFGLEIMAVQDLDYGLDFLLVQ